MKFILTALYSFVALATLGVFVYTNVIYERPKPENSEAFKEFQREMFERNNLTTFQLDKIVTNLEGQDRRLRFVELTAHLEPIRLKYLDLFQNYRPIIFDTIISNVSKMNPDELNSLTGRIILEERIKKGLQEHFGYPVVKKVFFSGFVVQ
jgi:flagellar protein FliL